MQTSNAAESQPVVPSVQPWRVGEAVGGEVGVPVGATVRPEELDDRVGGAVGPGVVGDAVGGVEGRCGGARAGRRVDQVVRERAKREPRAGRGAGAAGLGIAPHHDAPVGSPDRGKGAGGGPDRVGREPEPVRALEPPNL